MPNHGRAHRATRFSGRLAHRRNAPRSAHRRHRRHGFHPGRRRQDRPQHRRPGASGKRLSRRRDRFRRSPRRRGPGLAGFGRFHDAGRRRGSNLCRPGLSLRRQGRAVRQPRRIAPGPGRHAPNFRPGFAPPDGLLRQPGLRSVRRPAGGLPGTTAVRRNDRRHDPPRPDRRGGRRQFDGGRATCYDGDGAVLTNEAQCLHRHSHCPERNRCDFHT